VSVTLLNIDRIMRLRCDIRDALVLEFTGDEVVGERFDHFVRRTKALLPAYVPRKYIEESMTYLAGETLNRSKIDALAWRLAGNLHTLKTQPVTPWVRQPVAEWVPAQIMSLRRDHSRSIPSYISRVQVVAGLSCGMVIEKSWTVGFCKYLTKFLGFTKLSGKYPMHDMFEIVSMRFLAYIEPGLCSKLPGFRSVEVPWTLREHNRALITLRRRDRSPCPRKFSWPCHKCPVGYVECPAGCHRETYTFRRCSACEEEEAPFDPELQSDFCVNCNHRPASEGAKNG